MWAVALAAAAAVLLGAVHARGRLRDARKRNPLKALALVLPALLMVSGCAAQVHPPSACPEVRFPPAVYLQDVQLPLFTGVTNADLAAHVLDLRKAVERSNLDKARLRDFYASPPDPR
jgi:hypothetical protein